MLYLFSVHDGDMLVGVLNKITFRTMHEVFVLSRKEIMCSTHFSMSEVAYLRMTERNTTKRGNAIWKRKRDICRCDNGWKNYAGFVSRPDIFVRKVSTMCMTKRMEPHLWWSLLMDHSGDQQMDWLTYTQTHH